MQRPFNHSIAQPEPSLTPKNSSWVDWITMFLLIGNTANPFFYQSVDMLTFSLIILLVVLWFRKEGESTRLNGYFWIYIVVLTVLQASQSLVYHLFPLKTFLGEYLRIAFAAVALRILGQRFFPRFIQFVYVFAVISLCFYIPCMLLKPLGPFLVQHVAKYFVAPFTHAGLEDYYISKENLIIFNLGQIDLHRNSGFYWEPGTHGGFLVLALFLNLFYNKEKLNSRFNMVFAITIITTLSTTTYLAFFFLMLVYLKNFFVKRPWLSLFLLITVVGGAFVLYNKLDFLNEKINTQIENSDSGRPGESRFGSFMADVRQMSEHPLIGSGRSLEMKYGKNFYNVAVAETHRNNGVGVLLGTYGILFFFFFWYYTWLGFYRLLNNKTNATFGLALILLIGFSEDYFFKAFFIALALYCGITDISANRVGFVQSKKLKLGKNPIIY